MADQKKWFKVWTTLLIDSLSIPVEDIGRFIVLGCLIASRGDNGILVTDRKTLQALLQCKEIPPDFIKNFNIEITEIEGSCNGGLSVTMKNWNKYQVDSTGYERQQRYREAHSVTAKVTAKVTEQDKIRVDKIRVDKIRVDKNKIRKEILYPDWLPLETFNDFKEMRKQKKKPLTEKAEVLLLKKLAELKESGNDLKAVLEQSIMNSYQGVFEVKINKDTPKHGTAKTAGNWAILEKRKREGFYDSE